MANPYDRWDKWVRDVAREVDARERDELVTRCMALVDERSALELAVSDLTRERDEARAERDEALKIRMDHQRWRSDALETIARLTRERDEARIRALWAELDTSDDLSTERLCALVADAYVLRFGSRIDAGQIADALKAKAALEE